MKKFDFGQTVGIVANIGVIAGLAFLAIELSQNTDAMRSQTVNAFQAEFREIFDFPPGFVESEFKDPAERTAEEDFVRRSFFTRLMRIYENQWYQNQHGYLDDDLFRAYQQHLRITLGNDDFHQLWDLRKNLGFFHPEFVAYVDLYIAANPPYTTEQIATQTE